VPSFLGCPQIAARYHSTDARVVPLGYLKHVQVNVRGPELRYAVSDLMLGHGTGFFLLFHNGLVCYEFFLRTHRAKSGPRSPSEVSEGAPVFNYLIIRHVVKLNNHLLLIDLLAGAFPVTVD
jgi:hypothetical protein